MNQTQIGEGCEINKAIIAENVVVGNQVKLGVGEEREQLRHLIFTTTDL